MPDAAATWSPAPDLDRRLTGTRFREVRWFTAVDSTNGYLLAVGSAGSDDGIVAVADEQTAGRGRHGRVWSAAPGSALLVSVLLRPVVPRERLHLVTLAAAVAAAEAVQDVAGFEARLKWPNDLVVGGRKLAGVLAETGGAGAVVVGMGLNLRSADFPAEIADTATACDRHCARRVDRRELLLAWLHAFDGWLGTLEQPVSPAERVASNDVVNAAAARCDTLGRPVRVELERGTFEGSAVTLTSEGFLVVRTADGTERVVTAGDVLHLRPAEAV